MPAGRRAERRIVQTRHSESVAKVLVKVVQSPQMRRERGEFPAAGRQKELLIAPIHQNSDLVARDNARFADRRRFRPAIFEHSGAAMQRDSDASRTLVLNAEACFPQVFEAIAERNITKFFSAEEHCLTRLYEALPTLYILVMAVKPALAFRGQVILPDRVLEHGVVIIDRGRIVDVSRRKRAAVGAIDARDGFICPGFVDIHVHGGAGADYMDGFPDAVRTVNRAHLRRGTTTIFPTTTTGSPEQVERMVQACKAVQKGWTPEHGARIAGVHLYGPYFAAGKVGCHSREGRRDPSPAEYEALFQSNIIRIATCAAELPGAAEFYRAARRRKCLLTCGHSEATWTDMDRAFRAGMRHVDHFWCAMSSVPSLRALHGTPMQASMEQFVLANADMSTEVIADGRHLSPELLEFAYRMKGVERLCLVTDANRALGMPPGRYRFGPQEDGAWFESDGLVGFVPGQGLASSVVALDTMVRNMKAATSAPLHDVVRMASLTPAERTGIDDETGSLEPGKRADVLVLDRRLNVKRIFLDGEEVTVQAAGAS
jgi:N-acetylglucosamine-6-phosphate deacetylase